jgi:hypothetical protein
MRMHVGIMPILADNQPALTSGASAIHYEVIGFTLGL